MSAQKELGLVKILSGLNERNIGQVAALLAPKLTHAEMRQLSQLTGVQVYATEPRARRRTPSSMRVAWGGVSGPQPTLPNVGDITGEG